MKLPATFFFIIGAAGASAQTYTGFPFYDFAAGTGPTGIAVDSSGNVYVSGSFVETITTSYLGLNGSKTSTATVFGIAQISLNGFSLVEASNSGGVNSLPGTMAVDAAGDIYCAMTTNAADGLTGPMEVIEVTPPSWTITSLTGSSGATNIFGGAPSGIAINTAGLFITVPQPNSANFTSNQLMEYVPDGTPISIPTGQANPPQPYVLGGVAADSSDALYVSAVISNSSVPGYFTLNVIRIVSGSVVTGGFASGPPGNWASSQFQGGGAIAVDHAGNIFVGWYGTLFYSLAGPTFVYGSVANFGNIIGLATDSLGRIYVAYQDSTGAGHISVVTPTGVALLPTPTPTPTPTPIANPTSTPPTEFINISTRAFVGIGSSIAIAGFVISGSNPEQVLIRGVGPTLSQFSVSGLLAQPVLALYNSTGTQVATNTGWGTNTNVSQINAAFTATGAFVLPSGSADSALLLSLGPGAYTAQVSGLNNTTGNALIEVYQVPTPTPTPTP